MRHGATWIELEGERFGYPAAIEIVDKRSIVAFVRVREAVEQPMHALEHGARPEEAATRQEGRAQARLRRPSGMQPLGPSAFGEIFDDAGGKARRDAERIDDLLGGQAERSADAGGRTHGAEDRRRMEPGLMHCLRHHGGEAALFWGAAGDPERPRGPARPMPLKSR